MSIEAGKLPKTSPYFTKPARAKPVRTPGMLMATDMATGAIPVNDFTESIRSHVSRESFGGDSGVISLNSSESDVPQLEEVEICKCPEGTLPVPKEVPGARQLTLFECLRPYRGNNPNTGTWAPKPRDSAPARAPHAAADKIEPLVAEARECPAAEECKVRRKIKPIW